MTAPPIAILGQGCVLPGALTPKALWQAVAEGRDLTSDPSADRWGVAPDAVIAEPGAHTPPDKTLGGRGGYVVGFDAVWDPDGFAVPATALKGLDAGALWLLHAGRAAWREAGGERLDARAGVVVANLSYPSRGLADVARAVWRGETDEPGLRFENRFCSGAPAHLLADALGLEGPAFALDAACASSLYALKYASDLLADRRVDAMVVGAVNACDNLFLHMGFTALGALSPTGVARPFSRRADGLLPAEGAAAVVLVRAEDVDAGARVHGVIRGVGLSNDGKRRGLLAPDGDGQREAIARAYAAAEVDPASVSLLECHATGTPTGDPLEIAVLNGVFAGLDDLPVGSLKSNAGHLITAAGLGGLLKLTGALAHDTRPPTLHAEDAVDAFDAGPARPLLTPEPWPAGDRPRRAGLSAFGFGGCNAHLVLEEWRPARTTPATTPAPTEDPTEDIVICGVGASTGSARGIAAVLDRLETPAPDEPGARRDEIVLDLARLRAPPADLRKALAQQTWMFEVVDEALADVAEPAPERAGVFVGMGCDAEAARWALRWRDATSTDDKDAIVAPLDAAHVLGAMPNVPANRLNVHRDWRGLGFTVSSEELSGLDALRLAASALRRGELDLAIVGAVDLADEPVHAAALRALGRNVIPGDAAAAVALKRRTDAERDGDAVLAVLVSDPPDGASAGDDTALALAARFGVAHAASGLLALSVAAAAGAHGRRIDADGARAWLTPDAECDIRATSFTGRSAAARLRRSGPPRPAHLPDDTVPAIALYAADDADALATAVAEDARRGDGPHRLAIVAESPALLELARTRAADALAAGESPDAPGVRHAAAPLDGELALMFTGAAAAYPGMGRGLLAAFPDAGAAVGARFAAADPVAARLAHAPDALADPFEQLRATTLVSQVHAEVARELLGLKPTAALGLSSGETNALLAFGAWRDPDALLADVDRSEMYARWLAGRCESASAAWEVAEGEAIDWRCWRVLAPLDAVRKALADAPRVGVTIVHGPADCVIAGEAEACRLALARIAAAGGSAVPLGQDMVVHCAEAAPFAETWRAIHTRETRPVDGVRFYANATNVAYAPSREACAEMLTAQAIAPIDFAATVEQAWGDGVRLFVEMGPRDALTRAVGEVLGDRAHLAVSFDRTDRGDAHQIADAAAALWVAGTHVDMDALAARLDALAPADAPPAPQTPLRLPAHPPPVRAPRRAQAAEVIVLPRAPRLASAAAVEIPTARAAVAAGVMAPAPSFPPPPCGEGAGGGGLRARATPLDGKVLRTRTPTPFTPSPQGGGGRARGPSFTRAELEAATTGRISELFGPAFAGQDGFARQVRMPAPPLLLADRVTGIAGEPQVRGAGTIWTETDVGSLDGPDAWRLHAGRMRPGIVIESGQADLLLASWQGVDAENQGERVYRLLGCELTFHEGGLPAPGDTLAFQIDIERHARIGDVALFFFRYDAHLRTPDNESGGERPLLSVRNGQAGFFTDDELAQSGGVLWDPDDSAPPTATPRLAPLPRASQKRAFTARELDAWLRGDALACFGPGFARASAHQRTPAIPSGRLRMIDSVDAFDPTGGPWGRGYLRAAAAAPKDAWFYEGHFHNDPCMPGTLMAEAAVQAVETFMAAAGLTIDRDGWRFEPAPGEPCTFVCRGQVVPDADHALTYEVFVDEIVDGPEPVVYAALLARSDGFKVFYCPRFGVRLVRDWPISDRAEAATLDAAPRIVSPPGSEWGDVRGDFGALLACAWGRPSDAFGPMYARFDRESAVPRLPGPPYHAVSRILSVSCTPGAPAEGATVVAEYDPPDDAWYFDANGHAAMPVSVLMEALLQPCGWLASYCGFALKGGLAFRNLDGADAIVHREVRPGDGPLRVETTLTRWSSAGPLTIVFFDVACTCDGEDVMAFSTSFGFFPAAALAAQAGLPTDDALRARLAEPANATAVAPTQGRAAVPGGMLKMIDAITGFWPEGGEAGLGRIRGRQVVDPSAWYFKAHFYEDPVQPGSLGIDALGQLLCHALRLKGLDRELANPRFETPALGQAMSWKYRGQVTPEAKEVITTLDVTSIVHEADGVLATAKASLWVDGLRIYEADGVSAHIVEGAPAVTHTETLSLTHQPWLADHRPTYAVPALPMAGALNEVGKLLIGSQGTERGDAHAPPSALRATSPARGGRKPEPQRHISSPACGGGVDEVDGGGVARRSPGERGESDGLSRMAWPLVIEDFALSRWIVVEDSEVALEARAAPRGGGRFDVALFADGAPVATGRARVGGATAIDDWPTLEDLAPVADLYESGALFHGPRFHLLEDARRSPLGAEAALDAARAFDADDELDVGLVDALLHAIPHDSPELWFGADAAGRVAYPHTVERLVVHRPRPREGRITMRARPLGATDGRFARVAVRAESDDGVWLEMTLREALMPKGPLGDLAPADRRRFLAEGRVVADAGLTRAEGDATVLDLADVRASDWLPGTLARVYRLTSDDPAREIAVKEHAARAWRMHPRDIDVADDEARWEGWRMAVAATFDPAAQAWRVETREGGA